MFTVCIQYSASAQYMCAQGACFPQLQLVCAIAILLHSHSRASVK